MKLCIKGGGFIQVSFHSVWHVSLGNNTMELPAETALVVAKFKLPRARLTVLRHWRAANIASKPPSGNAMDLSSRSSTTWVAILILVMSDLIALSQSIELGHAPPKLKLHDLTTSSWRPPTLCLHQRAQTGLERPTTSKTRRSKAKNQWHQPLKVIATLRCREGDAGGSASGTREEWQARGNELVE
jgi:hypothetical protein